MLDLLYRSVNLLDQHDFLHRVLWTEVHHSIFLASAIRAEQLQSNMTPIKFDILPPTENVMISLSALVSLKVCVYKSESIPGD